MIYFLNRIPPFNSFITHVLRFVEERHCAVICGGIYTQTGMLNSPCFLSTYNVKKRQNIFTNNKIPESSFRRKKKSFLLIGPEKVSYRQWG